MVVGRIGLLQKISAATRRSFVGWLQESERQELGRDPGEVVRKTAPIVPALTVSPPQVLSYIHGGGSASVQIDLACGTDRTDAGMSGGRERPGRKERVGCR